MKFHRAGQRHSRQRDAILKVISKAQGPLSVSEIHQRARLITCAIAISTVYRNLPLLLQAGQIQRAMLHSGEPCYEVADLDTHENFQCRRCALVFHINDDTLHFPQDQIIAEGFVVESYQLTLYGICPTCHAGREPMPALSTATLTDKYENSFDYSA